jgi:hypothetical protein
VSGLLPVLTAVVRSSHDDEAICDALWALSYIADGSDFNILAVLQAGIVDRVVALVGHSATSIQTPALRTVGNIASGAARGQVRGAGLTAGRRVGPPDVAAGGGGRAGGGAAAAAARQAQPAQGGVLDTQQYHGVAGAYRGLPAGRPAALCASAAAFCVGGVSEGEWR